METSNSLDKIASKIIRGSIYSGGAGIITFILGFIRTVLLARLLLPEYFGVVALAAFYLGVSSIFRNFGLDSALIHYQRKDETLKRTYFSLRIGLNIIFTALLIISAPLIQYFYPTISGLKEVLIVFSIFSFVNTLNIIQFTLMHKELAFSSIAVIEIISAIFITIAAPYAAWIGWGLWALVVEGVGGIIVDSILAWGPFRRWRPRFGWDKETFRMFWKFGKPTWVKMNIVYLLDRFDDFWIGTALGQGPLGYYNKAYYFAGAPRRVFASPLFRVFVPVFAHVQKDRKRLSEAFSQCAYLLIRLVFFGAGMFVFIMPEFIHLVIGEKWMPMLLAFRLLLGYAVFDSLFGLLHGLFNAIGRPTLLRNTALIQAVVFFPTVVLGAYLYGIEGVSMAANGMLLIGISCLYRPLIETIDLSIKRLFLWPFIALGSALTTGIILESFLSIPTIQMFFFKCAVFISFFWGILITMERKDYSQHIKEVWKILVTRPPAKPEACIVNRSKRYFRPLAT